MENVSVEVLDRPMSGLPTEWECLVSRSRRYGRIAPAYAFRRGGCLAGGGSGSLGRSRSRAANGGDTVRVFEVWVDGGRVGMAPSPETAARWLDDALSLPDGAADEILAAIEAHGGPDGRPDASVGEIADRLARALLGDVLPRVARECGVSFEEASRVAAERGLAKDVAYMYDGLLDRAATTALIDAVFGVDGNGA